MVCNRQTLACDFDSHLARGVGEWATSQPGHTNSMMIIYYVPSIYLGDLTLFGRESAVLVSASVLERTILGVLSCPAQAPCTTRCSIPQPCSACTSKARCAALLRERQCWSIAAAPNKSIWMCDEQRNNLIGAPVCISADWRELIDHRRRATRRARFRRCALSSTRWRRRSRGLCA
jgi:hypothetical protein